MGNSTGTVYLNYKQILEQHADDLPSTKSNPANPEGNKLFRFYWLGGGSSLMLGLDPQDAYGKLYGGGAVSAVDFYSEGPDYSHQYQKGRGWVKLDRPQKEILPILGVNSIWVNHPDFKPDELTDRFNFSYRYLGSWPQHQAVALLDLIRHHQGPEQFATAFPGLRLTVYQDGKTKYSVADDCISLFVRNTEQTNDELVKQFTAALQELQV